GADGGQEQRQGGRAAGAGRRDGSRSANYRDLRANYTQSARRPRSDAVQGAGGCQGADAVLAGDAAGDPRTGVRGGGRRPAYQGREGSGRAGLSADRDAAGVGRGGGGGGGR